MVKITKRKVKFVKPKDVKPPKAEEAEPVVNKAEEARLKKSAEERAAKEQIQREKDIEARALTIKNLKLRQKFLDNLYRTLKEEGINSIGDLENKQAKAQRDLEDEEKKVI